LNILIYVGEKNFETDPKDKPPANVGVRQYQKKGPPRSQGQGGAHVSLAGDGVLEREARIKFEAL
jgi:hypothetical protein